MAKNQSTALARDEHQQEIEKQQKDFRSFVLSDGVRSRLVDVASKYMKPDELMRCLLVAVSKTPKILECTRDSVLRCMMEAAQVGIRPGGQMGRGWLIPRWNSKVKALELNFDPGWRGLVDIARRSRLVTNIEADVVYASDKFRVIRGTEPKLIHEPYDGPDDPGPIVNAYAVAFFENGRTQFERLRRRDLDKIQSKSESKDRDTGESVGPWNDWYEEMARKSAVRRLCKYLPVDEELQQAIEIADRATPIASSVPSLTAEPPKPRAEQLADRIKAKNGDTEPSPPLSPEDEAKLKEAEEAAKARRDQAEAAEKPREREPGED